MVTGKGGNAKMKTVDIKGKPYIEVNERVKYFRENYKDWSLISELISNENGVCVFKASVIDESGVIRATGYAYEKENSTFINKTSYIENCETSAWGRALGNLGIGIDTSIASYDEIANAQENQNEQVQSNQYKQAPKEQNKTSNKPDKPTDVELTQFRELLKLKGITESEFLSGKYYKSLESMNCAQYEIALKQVQGM